MVFPTNIWAFQKAYQHHPLFRFFWFLLESIPLYRHQHWLSFRSDKMLIVKNRGKMAPSFTLHRMQLQSQLLKLKIFVIEKNNPVSKPFAGSLLREKKTARWNIWAHTPKH